MLGLRTAVGLGLLIASVSGSAVWQFQTLRYHAQLAQCQATHRQFQANLALAQAQAMATRIDIATRTDTHHRQQLAYLKARGRTLIREVTQNVKTQDRTPWGVTRGFVRLYNAAFRGKPPSPPTESDRTPAGISLPDLATTTIFNANVCQQWRAQALGWEMFYQQLRKEKKP